MKSKFGKNYLIDPFLNANPGCPEQYLKPEFLKTIHAVLLTHGHFDHTEGLQHVVENNPDVNIVAQYDLGLLLMQKGFQHVQLINIGGKVRFEDMSATMVKANHSSSYNETVGSNVCRNSCWIYV